MPSASPTRQPSARPSRHPSSKPSSQPTYSPSVKENWFAQSLSVITASDQSRPQDFKVVLPFMFAKVQSGNGFGDVVLNHTRTEGVSYAVLGQR
eukprot:gene47344-biopygen12263